MLLIYIFMMVSEVEHLFIYLLVFRSFAYFKVMVYGNMVFLLLNSLL